jgi:hypothetical protein
MIGNKILALAGVAVLVAVQSGWAADPRRPANGNGQNVGRPQAQPATPFAGSPTIYYSNQPYVQPSLVPPSMNLLPSIGYSTGFNTTGMNNMNLGYSTGFNVTGMNSLPRTAPSAGTLGNRTYSPPVYTFVGSGFNYVPTTVIVNQYYYYQPPCQYTCTTNAAPAPRLTFGVLNN